jgi:hypothetical protein
VKTVLLLTTALTLCVPALAEQSSTVAQAPSMGAMTRQPWTMRGVNAGVQDALQGFANAMQDFPGMTAIRLNCDPGNDPAADIDTVVREYTGAGVVVEIEDHSGNPDNVAWYQQMAQAYKGNALVYLEMPNEPTADAQTTAQNQIGIIQAVRAAGFTNPIGVQPVGGYDFSNLPMVISALGTAGLFVTPHIYYNGTDPNGAADYVQSDLQQAKALGLWAVIDEFGNAMDGFTLDPQGNAVILAVIAVNEGSQAGGVFWAMDNGNHPDGSDSAFLNPDGSQLTPVGQSMIQPWLWSAQPAAGTTSAPSSRLTPEQASELAGLQQQATVGQQQNAALQAVVQSLPTTATPASTVAPVAASPPSQAPASVPASMPSPAVVQAPASDPLSATGQAALEQRIDTRLARFGLTATFSPLTTSSAPATPAESGAPTAPVAVPAPVVPAVAAPAVPGLTAPMPVATPSMIAAPALPPAQDAGMTPAQAAQLTAAQQQANTIAAELAAARAQLAAEQQQLTDLSAGVPAQ